MEPRCLDDALGVVASHAGKLNHRLTKQIEWESFHGNVSKGYHFRHVNGSAYLVYGADYEEFLVATYQFDVVSHVASQLSDEEVETCLNASQAPQTENERPEKTAARAKLDALDADGAAEMKRTLADAIESPHVLNEVQEAESGVVCRFYLHRHLFPYEGSLTLERYNDVTRTLVTLGKRGARACVDELNLPDAARPADFGAEPPTDTRGFQ